MAHKLGIIGYGGMATYHHRRIKECLSDILTVTAAFDIDNARCELAENSGLKVFDNADDFFASNLFDIVLVATPNNFHPQYVISALEHGYHAVCEKPVAITVKEFDSMVEAAKKNGKIFSVHQNRRWDRDYRIVKEAIDKGLIGKPYSIESRVHGQNGVVHGWREFKVAGGGMLFDWGVHQIDQIVDMMNGEKIVSVYANLHSVRTPEVDDYYKLILRFSNGTTAQIETSTYTLIQQPRWYAYGDGGSLIIEGWDCKGRIIRAKDHMMNWEPVVVQTVAGPTRTMAPRPVETLEEIPLPTVDPHWSEYYQNVIAAIDGKEKLIVDEINVRRVLQVMEAAFESDRLGAGIACEI